MDLTTAAHDYARRGWRVLPLHRVNAAGDFCSCHKGGNCTSKGKHPIDNAWQKSERLSPADIQATWDVDKAPNIGLATGADSGFWVLDIDPKNGGMEHFGALLLEHGGEAMPATVVAETGSGGYHYLFALPDFEVRNSADRVCKGVDVRGQGGQIVAAPSRTDKGSYRIIQDEPLAQAPGWLLDLIRKEEVDPSTIVTAVDLPKPEDLDEATFARYNEYAQRAVDAELKRLDNLKTEGWEGEPWNHTTFEVSCALIEFGNSPWCAYNSAQADVMARAPRDADGFDDYTVAKTFGSAVEKVGPKARQQPQDRVQEPDSLMMAPEVRDLRAGPTGGGERPASLSVGPFFGGDKGSTPLYPNMGRAVMAYDDAPIGWGIDNDFWRYEDGTWVHDGDVVKHRLIDILDMAWKSGHYPSVHDWVQRHAKRLSAEPHEAWMNFRNTMLDWSTGETFDHAPDLGSTVQFGCDWDPEATCPKFDAWLEETLDPDSVELAWEMLGYLMLSGNPLHHAFLLYGIGGSGKSTLLGVIEEMLGRTSISSDTLDALNGNSFRAANLFGKIANIAGDIDPKFQDSTAMFKRITGQDMITAERKHRDPFQFVNWAVPVFSANRIPGSADVTEGYLRRWIILRFANSVPKEDRIKYLAQRLFAAEGPGIANKAVAALRVLMDRGVDGMFDPKGEALKAVQEFELTIDQVKRWFADGQATVGPEVTTKIDRIYSHYRLWAERTSQSPLGQVEFGHRLESMGFPAERIGGETYHRGISVPDINHHTKASTETFFDKQ